MVVLSVVRVLMLGSTSSGQMLIPWQHELCMSGTSTCWFRSKPWSLFAKH